MTGTTRTSTHRELSAEQAARVQQIVADATRGDAVAPISEHQLLRLSGPNPQGRWQHLLAEDERGIVGYAIIDLQPEAAEAELVVDPSHRRSGVGSALLRALDTAAGDVPLSIWSHGHLPAAKAFAAEHGLDAVRILHQLRRPLADDLPPYDVSDAVRLRAFDPERDEQAWVALNAAAFAHHPEQGSWTLDDLRDREREPWFDPEGFLIAEAVRPLGELRPGELAGFHWTKIHGPSTADLAADPQRARDALGEVYVVGVNPRAQGSGLGKVLTIAGLEHLRAKDLPTVLLYVDDDNTPAMRLYERLGFTGYAVDVQYRR